jgi:hypothetical protein
MRFKNQPYGAQHSDIVPQVPLTERFVYTMGFTPTISQLKFQVHTILIN